MAIQLTPSPHRRNPMAEHLMGQAVQGTPVGHPLGALSRAVQGFVGGKMMAKDRDKEQAAQNALAQMLAGNEQVQSNPLVAQLLGNPDTQHVGAQLGLGLATQGAPAPVKGSPGDVFFNPRTGEEQFSVPAEPEGQTTATRTREAKIKDQMDTLGLERAQAVRIVDGVDRLTVDDRGNRVITNMASGESRLLEVKPDQPPPRIMPPPPTSPDDLAFNPGEGTGAVASALMLWNRTAGQLPFAPIAEGPEKAAQQMRITERDAIRALASSGRPPVIEQERIIRALPSSEEWLANPEVANSKMTSFVDLMLSQYIDDIRYASDPMNDSRTRSTSRERASNIESIVNRVLKPEAASAAFQAVHGAPPVTVDPETQSLIDRYAPQ